MNINFMRTHVRNLEHHPSKSTIMAGNDSRLSYYEDSMPRQPEDGVGGSEPTEMEDDSEGTTDQLSLSFHNKQTYGLGCEGEVQTRKWIDGGLAPMSDFVANTDYQHENITIANSDMSYATAEDIQEMTHKPMVTTFHKLGQGSTVRPQIHADDLYSQPAPRQFQVQMSAEDYAKMATQTLQTVQSMEWAQDTRPASDYNKGVISTSDQGLPSASGSMARGVSLQSPIHLDVADINLDEYHMPADGGASLLKEDEQHFAKLNAQGKTLSLEDQAYYATLRSYLAAKSEDDRKRKGKDPSRKSVEFAGIEKTKGGKKKGRRAGEKKGKNSKVSKPEIVSGDKAMVDEAHEGADFADDEGTPTLETIVVNTVDDKEKENPRPKRQQSIEVASTTKQRGRPKKSLLAEGNVDDEPTQRGRGRPEKSLLMNDNANDMAGKRRSDRIRKSASPVPEIIRGGRGRPEKRNIMAKRKSNKPAQTPVMLYSGGVRGTSARPSAGDIIARDRGITRKKGLRTTTTPAKRPCEL